MSQSNKHTPGPWYVRVYFGRHFNIFKDGYWICRVRGEENANLIAAAPELLEALIVVADTFGEDWREGSTQRRLGDKARAAIAKATGEMK